MTGPDTTPPSTGSPTTGAPAPATSAGTTRPAGEGVADEQLAHEVADQTSSDLEVEQVFENEGESTYGDTEAARASADELGG